MRCRANCGCQQDLGCSSLLCFRYTCWACSKMFKSCYMSAFPFHQEFPAYTSSAGSIVSQNGSWVPRPCSWSHPRAHGTGLSSECSGISPLGETLHPLWAICVSKVSVRAFQIFFPEWKWIYIVLFLPSKGFPCITVRRCSVWVTGHRKGQRSSRYIGLGTEAVVWAEISFSVWVRLSSWLE